jgi:hypothetical protein
MEDMDALVRSLACELNVPSSVFGEAHQMFWRFNFAGDGHLYEEDGTQLIMSMLRRYRESTHHHQFGIAPGRRLKSQSMREYYDTL